MLTVTLAGSRFVKRVYVIVLSRGISLPSYTKRRFPSVVLFLISEKDETFEFATPGNDISRINDRT